MWLGRSLGLSLVGAWTLRSSSLWAVRTTLLALLASPHSGNTLCSGLAQKCQGICSWLPCLSASLRPPRCEEGGASGKPEDSRTRPLLQREHGPLPTACCQPRSRQHPCLSAASEVSGCPVLARALLCLLCVGLDFQREEPPLGQRPRVCLPQAWLRSCLKSQVCGSYEVLHMLGGKMTSVQGHGSGTRATAPGLIHQNPGATTSKPWIRVRKVT